MSHIDCTSKPRTLRLRWLGRFAGVVLLSSPVLADDMALLPPPASESEQTAVVVEPIVEAAVSGTNDCNTVRIADAANIVPAAPPLASKSAAILGGEISSLDRIRMVQSGLAPLPMAEPQLTRTPIDVCGKVPFVAAQAPVQAMTDERLILGSLRLSIRKTPFDQQWNKVSRPEPSRGLQRWVARAGAARTSDPYMKVAAINRWANQQISYADDIATYRQNDFWASSRETLRRRKGDCEDYAILKMDLLAAAGIDRDRMILVIARDLVRNADHAVLVVQLDDGPVVLDNATDELLDGRLSHDYRPIMSFASNGKWLHGYAVAQPAAEIPAEQLASIDALNAPSTPVIALSTPVLADN
jgi:predicted transglutaminase-like cysteine proteinase